MLANTKRLVSLALFASFVATPVDAAGARTVVVKPGDTLGEIAERELGRTDRLLEICTLNRKVLKYDCDHIPVGTVLMLPTRVDSHAAQVKRAGSASQSHGDRTALGGDFVARLERSGGQTLNSPKSYQVIPSDNFIRLSGHVANAVSTGTPGVWLQLPESIERQASGKTIVVQVLVRAPIPGPIALAYSTNEVGNSGWVTRSAGTTFRTVSFTYEVPTMKDGRGDYVGILPDPKNARQVTEVAGIAVAVLGQ